MTLVIPENEESVISLSGQKENRKVMLFNGLPVDVSQASPEAFNLKTLAVSLYNTPRWNGHLRIPAHFSARNRCLDDGLGQQYAFYPVMSHCVLVAICAVVEPHDGSLAFSPDDVEGQILLDRYIRLALIHEAPEEVIGDLPGPFKRLVKPHVKPFEDAIQDVAFKAIEGQLRNALRNSDLRFERDTNHERAHIKRADIMAQDIEAHFGMKNHIVGVNISKGFVLHPWMEKALRFALNVQVARFVDFIKSPLNIISTLRTLNSEQPQEIKGDDSASGALAELAKLRKQLQGNPLSHALFLRYSVLMRKNEEIADATPAERETLIDGNGAVLQGQELTINDLMRRLNDGSNGTPYGVMETLETATRLVAHGHLSVKYLYCGDEDDYTALDEEMLELPEGRCVQDTIKAILDGDEPLIDPVSGENMEAVDKHLFPMFYVL